LRKAYRARCKQHHPDKNLENIEAAGEHFKRIVEAWNCLSDPRKKQIYDSSGYVGLEIEADEPHFFANGQCAPVDSWKLSSWFNVRTGHAR